MFSINVLAYGDHPDILGRCLGSLLASFDGNLISDVRVGMNAVGDRSWQIIREFAEAVPVTCHVYSETYERNVMKYPLMRRMLYDPERPLKGSRVVWFDDDSFMWHGARWSEADRVWRANKPAIMGSIYYPAYTWTQTEKDAISEQPWYTGAPLATKPKFVQGGFWIADKEFLAKWDYPFRELRHNGGDVILGELCRQQKAQIVHFSDLIGINADKNGKESAAKRRGVTTSRLFENPPPYDYGHHDFEVKVETFT